MALRPRQRLFVEAYAVSKNATQAAIAAGYSKKTAHSTGHENINKPEIKLAIEKKLSQQARRLAAKSITKERWLEELGKIALADMDDYATVEEVKSSLGKTKKVVDVVPTKERMQNYSGGAIKKLAETKNGISIELHSKESALLNLGKHFGWIKETLNLNSDPNGSPVMVIALPENGRQVQAPQPLSPEEMPAPRPSGEDVGSEN